MKKKSMTKEQLEAWVANVERYRDEELAQWIADTYAFIANMGAVHADDSGSNPPPPSPPPPNH